MILKAEHIFLQGKTLILRTFCFQAISGSKVSHFTVYFPIEYTGKSGKTNIT